LERETAVRKKQAHATAVFNAMLIDVTRKGQRLRSAATRIGKAYSVAAGRHRDALAKQDQVKAMETQLLFSVLTVLTSGALSWATAVVREVQASVDASRLAAIEALGAQVPAYGGVLERLVQRLKEKHPQEVSARELMTTVLEDTLVAGVGELFASMGPYYSPPPPSTPANQEPLEFQDDLVSQIDDIEAPALDFLSRMANRIKDTPDAEWDKYDDRKFQTAYQDWQKEANKLADVEDLPDEKTMTDDLERLIWALWVPRLYTREVRTSSRVYHGEPFESQYEVDVYARVYRPVDDRFVALHIETQSDTDLPRQEEDTKLIAWGKSYLEKVKPWVKGEHQPKG
jgi:hypothetical protein